MSSSNLTATLRSKIIADFCAVVKDQYVYPDLGEVISRSLKQKLQSGEYDSFESSEAFATRLTEDVQEVRICFIWHEEIVNKFRLATTCT